MPLDTTEFDKRIAETRYSVPSYDGKRTYTGQQEAVMQMALEVVKANFPDLIAKTHSKVSAKEPSHPGASGEYIYGLLSGESDGIRLSNADNISPAFMASTDSKTGKRLREKVNFTTEDVLRGAETVLHEMYHARSRAGYFNAGGNFSDLTPEQKARVNEIAQNPYKSGSPFGRPLNSMFSQRMNEEEFMANASALLDMKERGLIMEGTDSAKRLHTLEMIMFDDPAVVKYIGARRDPNIRTLSAPPTGTLGAILSAIDAAINDYSVKETSGGAKPGTPRASGKEKK